MAWSNVSRERNPVRMKHRRVPCSGMTWRGPAPDRGATSRPPRPAPRSSAPPADLPGFLPGIDEVLRRNDLPEATCRLDPRETLSPGSGGEIERGDRASPHLRDNAFVPEDLN